ncbi:MAG: ATP-binding cassette domain-containing protein [Clostridiales bacterium]|nr:ATP-binding cassette domain-containing protein [Clostridiales bacterium]
MNALEIRDLTKHYAGFSLDHLNLTLPWGCIMGLVGENGAGKSTTIKLILNTISRDGGTVTILGHDNRENLCLSKEEIGVVLDEATSGLDPVVRDEVMDIFNEFTRDENHAILISSHIVSDLEKICDYIAFLHKGKLILCEEKDRLKEEYGVLHCTAQDAAAIPVSAIVGKRVSPLGCELLVKRSGVPGNPTFSPVDIEQLFIFMAKEEH